MRHFAGSHGPHREIAASAIAGLLAVIATSAVIGWAAASILPA